MFVFLNKKKYYIVKNNLNLTKTKIIEPDEIYEYIINSKSDFSILAISGYYALNFILPIFSNTKNSSLQTFIIFVWNFNVLNCSTYLL